MTRFQPTTDPQPQNLGSQAMSDWVRERHHANHERMEAKYGVRLGLVKPEPEAATAPEPKPQIRNITESKPADTRTLEEQLEDAELEVLAARYRVERQRENRS